MVSKQSIEALYTSCSSWYNTDEGKSTLEQINGKLVEYLSQTFGYYALEMGALTNHQHFLENARIGTCFSVGQYSEGTDIRAKPEALPLDFNSIDLVIASHIFECSPQPHQVLREIDRVLVADGQCVFIGFNPLSLLFSHRSLHSLINTAPHEKLYGVSQIRDWLSLLNWKVNKISYLGFRPTFLNGKLFEQGDKIEKWGQLYWPIFGKLYIIYAQKQTFAKSIPTKSWRRPILQSGVAINPIPRNQQSREHK